MQVFLSDSGTGSKTSVEVATGSMVSDAFRAADISVSGDMAIYVNNRPSSMTDRLSPGDTVKYLNTALKGQDEDLKALVYEDIISAGTREVPQDAGLWQQIYAERVEKARKAMLRVSAQILTHLEVSISDSNAEVAFLKKQLADAENRQSRLRYATKQFTDENNIFSPLAAMGMKDSAPCFCAEIGVAVPDGKSPLWHTSESDATA